MCNLKKQQRVYLFHGDDCMFFIFGVSSKKDKLDFNQKMVCPGCGRYGRYEAFMEYTYLSLFFMPVLKWDKKYYVRSSCCGSVYSVSNDIGDKISKNENVDLAECDLRLIKRGRVHSTKRCSNCNYEINDDFQYCPKCGTILK